MLVACGSSDGSSRETVARAAPQTTAGPASNAGRRDAVGSGAGTPTGPTASDGPSPSAGASPPAVGSAARPPALLAPSTVRVGQRITVTASGLAGDRLYRLSIGAPPTPGSPSTCGADLTSARTDGAGAVRFVATLPGRLRCLQPDGSPTGTVALAPEPRPHLLAVCVPLSAVHCDGTYPDARRPVRIAMASTDVPE